VCKLRTLKLDKISLEDEVGERRVRGSGLSCPVWRFYSKGEFRSIIGSSIIGIWAISRETGSGTDIERSERIVFTIIYTPRTI